MLVDPVDGLASTEHRQQVELIASSAGELIDLVSQLLDLAKAESGRLDPTWTAVDLTALLSDVVAMSRPLALNDVMIEFAAPSETVVVTTDEHLLRQVVRNLLSNALAFTEVGTVRVRVSVEPDGTVIVDVEDSGVGLSPENIDRVFEEFFQVRNHLQSRRRGTGLGLPYSRRVIEALGGTLTASSRPGVGSTFRVQLQPLAAETEAGPTSNRIRGTTPPFTAVSASSSSSTTTTGSAPSSGRCSHPSPTSCSRRTTAPRASML